MSIVPGTDARRTVVNEPIEEAVALFLENYREAITDEERTKALEKLLMDTHDIYSAVENILDERKA